VKTTSRNTIRIALGAEFDLMIAQSQIKDGKIVDPKKRYYLASTRTKTRHPFKKEQSQIELLSFNSPSCCLSSTN
jgi:hypothetical protein